MSSIDSSFQPPSPSLSPTTQIRCYQSQLEKAHSMIDQLELILADKQIRNKENTNTSNITKAKQHSKNLSLTIDPISIQEPYRQYVTPRESHSRTSCQSQSLGLLSPIHLPSYIQELQQRHQELLSNSKEESLIKEGKIKEVQELILQMKEEISRQQERKRRAIYENKQNQYNNLVLHQEIDTVNQKLKESKEAGIQLESLLQNLDQEKENKANNYFVASSLKRKRSEVKPVASKPCKEMKQQLMQLKQDVQQLKQQKQEYEEYYDQRIKELQNQLGQSNIQVDDLNAGLSPNQQKVRIYKGDEMLIELKLSDRVRTEQSKYDNLDDLRIYTDSDARFCRKKNDEISVQSFKSQKQQKNRSCEACIIF